MLLIYTEIHRRRVENSFKIFFQVMIESVHRTARSAAVIPPGRLKELIRHSNLGKLFGALHRSSDQGDIRFFPI